jgi:hypothetical protein
MGAIILKLCITRSEYKKMERRKSLKFKVELDFGVAYLWESICMCRDNCYIARFWMSVVEWCILFYGNVKDLILMCRCCSGECTDV